jgi:hypothetical protein
MTTIHRHAILVGMRLVVALVLCLMVAGCGGSSSPDTGVLILAKPKTAPKPITDGNGDPVHLRLGPQLDPANLTSLPEDGIAVSLSTMPETTVFVGLDGRVYGHIPEKSMRDHLVASDGRGLVPAPPTPGFVTVGNCLPAVAPYVLCPRHHVAAIVDGRTGRVLADGWPEAHGVGFQSASLSPDGRTLLASWSGECESPRAVFVPIDGGRPWTADGKSSPASSVESAPLGWTADGRAVVYFEFGACAIGAHTPGVYSMTPRGKATLIYATRRINAYGSVW